MTEFRYLVIVGAERYVFCDSAPAELAVLSGIDDGLPVQLFGLAPLDIPTFLA